MTLIHLGDRVVGYTLTGSGPTVVLCHSLGATRAIFHAQVESLARDHTILTYDLRGHGETTRGDREPSLEVLADDLVELLDALSIGPAHFVGQSIGGMTLFQFAASQPARPATYVIVDAVASTTPEWDVRYSERADEVSQHGLTEIAATVAARSIGPSAQQSDAGLVHRYATTLAATDVAAYGWACRAMIGFDLLPELRSVSAPVLVLTGAQDDLTPASSAREAVAAMPNAFFEEIPDSGHVPCLEQPEFLTSRIRSWVAANPLAGA